jgi:hypothetical protein
MKVSMCRAIQFVVIFVFILSVYLHINKPQHYEKIFYGCLILIFVLFAYLLSCDNVENFSDGLSRAHPDHIEKALNDLRTSKDQSFPQKMLEQTYEIISRRNLPERYGLSQDFFDDIAVFQSLNSSAKEAVFNHTEMILKLVMLENSTRDENKKKIVYPSLPSNSEYNLMVKMLTKNKKSTLTIINGELKYVFKYVFKNEGRNIHYQTTFLITRKNISENIEKLNQMIKIYKPNPNDLDIDKIKINIINYDFSIMIRILNHIKTSASYKNFLDSNEAIEKKLLVFVDLPNKIPMYVRINSDKKCDCPVVNNIDNEQENDNIDNEQENDNIDNEAIEKKLFEVVDLPNKIPMHVRINSDKKCDCPVVNNIDN